MKHEFFNFLKVNKTYDRKIPIKLLRYLQRASAKTCCHSLQIPRALNMFIYAKLCLKQCVFYANSKPIGVVCQKIMFSKGNVLHNPISSKKLIRVCISTIHKVIHASSLQLFSIQNAEKALYEVKFFWYRHM